MFSTAVELGEGFRTGALGAPRYGKSTWLMFVIEQAIKQRHGEYALVHDTKRADPQYEGTLRVDLADFLNRPPQPGESRVVVFHQQGERVPAAQDVALLGLDLAKAGIPNIVVIDELYKALKGRQAWDWVPPNKAPCGEILREGSSQHVSFAWTTQVPQSLPTEACDLTETIAIFNLQGRSLSYAVDQFRLTNEAADTITRLERGEFVLVSNVGDWDNTIYGPA